MPTLHGEGLTDGDEVHVHATNPKEPDTDFDGLDDLIEVTCGTDPSPAAQPTIHSLIELLATNVTT